MLAACKQFIRSQPFGCLCVRTLEWPLMAFVPFQGHFLYFLCLSLLLCLPPYMSLPLAGTVVVRSSESQSEPLCWCDHFAPARAYEGTASGSLGTELRQLGGPSRPQPATRKPAAHADFSCMKSLIPFPFLRCIRKSLKQHCFIHIHSGDLFLDNTDLL